MAFNFVEEKINIWRSEAMLAAGKNYLLRMCNNLLRRLSTLRNTVFCGRIQLFLAQLLPLDEKSALNIMGAFNLDNVTVYASDPSVNDDNFQNLNTSETGAMDTDDSKTVKDNKAIDYELYKKFWALQDYFRNPNQCYDRQKWSVFVSNVVTVLKIFAQHKLETLTMKQKSLDGMESEEEENVYFPKNLTSEKLFDLQLGDVNFRRHVLVQLLVLFQYLLMKDVKFKPQAHQTTPDDMVAWINSHQEKVYALLEESPPNGSLLVKTLKHVLAREQIWNSWKNNGCPAYVKSDKDKDVSSDSPAVNATTKARTRRTYIGDSFPKDDGGPPSKKLNLGNKEMTNLWNIEPDNLKACRAENRRIFPEVKDFFQEAAEQLEPGAGVEKEYLLVLKPNYQWCALRLLARRSTLFFQPNSQYKTVPDFLKAIIDRTFNAKSVVKAEPTSEKNAAANGSMTPSRTETSLEKASGASQQVNGSDEAEDPSTTDTAGVGNAEDGTNGSVVDDSRAPNENEMDTIAKHIPADNLKDLAVQLDFKDDEIDLLEKASSEWCVNMLKQWIDREGEEATVSNLVQSLLDVELSHIVFRVYPKLLPAQYRKKAMEMLEQTSKPTEEEPMVVS